MKGIFRKVCALLCATLLLTCGLAACKPKEPTEPTEPTGPTNSVTVSLSEYDAAHGKVEVSAPANGTSYAVGEKVTVTPKPDEGYEVGSVTLNDEVLKATDGALTFDYAEHATVKASFHLKEADLPAVKGLPIGTKKFDRNFRGTWISADGTTSLYISETKMAIGDVGIEEVRPNGSSSEQSYTFTWKEKSYTISWLHYYYSVGYVIKLSNADPDSDEAPDYFILDPIADVTVEEHFTGDWVDMKRNEIELKINGNDITYNGKEAWCVVDLGYKEHTEDGWNGNIASHVYYFFTDDGAFFLAWYPEEGEGGPCPTIDAENYWKDEARTYTFAEFFRGTWDSLDGAHHITIDETSFKYDNTAITARGQVEYSFNVKLGDVTYEVKMHTSSDYVLALEHNIYDEEGRITHIEYTYYVKSGIPAVTVNAALYGDWHPKETTGTANDLHVSAAGITWGSDAVTVVDVKSDAVNGYSYLVSVRGSIYVLAYMNIWENWEGEGEVPPEGTPEWEFSLDGNGTRIVFEK